MVQQVKATAPTPHPGASYSTLLIQFSANVLEEGSGGWPKYLSFCQPLGPQQFLTPGFNLT